MPLRPPYCAAATPGSGGLATIDEARFGLLHHAYGNISAQGPSATTAGPIPGHLRLLYADIGTDQPGRPGSPNCGAVSEAPDDSKK